MRGGSGAAAACDGAAASGARGAGARSDPVGPYSSWEEWSSRNMARSSDLETKGSARMVRRYDVNPSLRAAARVSSSLPLTLEGSSGKPRYVARRVVWSVSNCL